YLVQEASLLLLNKMDLLPYVPFDQQKFARDVRRLNASIPVLELSALRGTGMEVWLDWVRHQAAGKTGPTAPIEN
ncbi:MAG: hydrogenase accessory protein HypB, partial [Phycisphaerae bacterium]